MRTRRGRGLTLIEALIALAVLAIVLALALPSWAGLGARHRLHAAGAALVDDLALTREEAVRRGVALYLLPQSGPRWCWAISAQAGCDCREPAAGCALRVVDADSHRGVELVAAAPMRLDPQDGRSDGGLAATLRAGAALAQPYAAQVHLHPNGRARLCSSGAPLHGVPAC